MKSLCILSLAGSSVVVYYAYDATEWTVRGDRGKSANNCAICRGVAVCNCANEVIVGKTRLDVN
jgi:hypothetical protein